MHISKTLDGQEYLYVIPEIVVKKHNNTEIEYHRYKFMDDINLLFKDWLKDNRSDLLNLKTTCSNKCRDYCEYCTDEELALSEMNKELYFLIHKLDKLTVYEYDKQFDLDKEKQKLLDLEPYIELKNNKIDRKKQKYILRQVSELKNNM